MVITILNNGKLLKPQTLDSDNELEDYLQVDEKTIFGVNQETSPTSKYEDSTDWTASFITGSTKKKYSSTTS